VSPGSNGNIPAFAVLGAVVPEPSALILAWIGLFGAASLLRR
jgi:hypothetical protein